MEKEQKTMKISTRLFIVNGIFLILTSAAIVALVNYSMRQHALAEAESKINIMADQYFAVHTYFSQKLKPAIFELTDSIRSKEYFNPTWMSSTYAVREINKYIRSQGGGEYYLRDAAINARSPENEASPFEKKFISELNANSKLKNRSSIQIFDGKPYLVLLRRGELMEESCIRCHGSPDQAPRDMVRYYGPERSFYRKVGDWPHAISIKVPLSLAYADANRFSFKLSGLLLGLLFILFGLQFWFNKRLFFIPLNTIYEKALLISNDIQHLGEEIPLPSGRELRELTNSFNQMSINLRHSTDHLEERVQERTAELEKVNKQLEKEVEERKKAEEKIKASLKEKEVLLREIHHRVKNNMQLLISLLRLQADKIEDKKYADMFKEGEDRIRSMSLIHEKLYQTQDFANINFGEHIKSLVDGLFVSYGVDTNKVSLNIDIKDVFIDLENAIPCGLIINELVSNSLKYAFPQAREGKISIALRPFNEDELELTVSDDGVGIAEVLDIEKTDTMGLTLVKVLAGHQLDGKIDLDRTEGTQFNIKFKSTALNLRK